mmetsp:Transcript_7577/g.10926  ORF Transcript_7577/g.10926 Transcript_7577/m.10926 type:complete len:256 (-) Transcript_7577:1125-1892(-)
MPVPPFIDSVLVATPAGAPVVSGSARLRMEIFPYSAPGGPPPPAFDRFFLDFGEPLLCFFGLLLLFFWFPLLLLLLLPLLLLLLLLLSFGTLLSSPGECSEADSRSIGFNKPSVLSTDVGAGMGSGAAIDDSISEVTDSETVILGAAGSIFGRPNNPGGGPNVVGMAPVAGVEGGTGGGVDKSRGTGIVVAGVSVGGAGAGVLATKLPNQLANGFPPPPPEDEGSEVPIFGTGSADAAGAGSYSSSSCSSRSSTS